MTATASIQALVSQRNQDKFLYTAGPASLLPENLYGLRPSFGRGDADYDHVEQSVMSALKQMTGHAHIVRLQGSATLALEIASLNFLYGRVLVVQTGYYSARLQALAESAMRQYAQVQSVQVCDWQSLDSIDTAFDWIVACYTETSVGLKLPMQDLHALAQRCQAKVLLDATASIGLEPDHHLADVIAYSSCKGLFGLTGAAFIAYYQPPTVAIDSFYLDMQSHVEKRMTGPYHAICSLYEVLPQHAHFKQAVMINKAAFLKRITDYETRPSDYQPQLCTWVNAKVSSADARAVLYQPRGMQQGSVVCHLGEAHLGALAQAEILNALSIG